MRRTLAAAQIRVEALEERTLLNGFPIVPTVMPPRGWAIYQEIHDAAGDIILVGSAPDATRIFGPTTDFAVARYTADGQLDPSFGNGGMVVTALNPFDVGDIAYDAVVQPDGKLVVVGSENPWRYLDELGTVHVVSGGFALVRYNTDGSLDTTFGSGGEVITPISSPLTPDWSWAQALAVALQPDGSIVVAGTASGPGLPDPPPSSFISGMNEFTIARYTGDGQLDNSFGTGGVVQVCFGGRDVADAVSVNADGTILVCGTSEPFLFDPAMGGIWPDGSVSPTPDSTVNVWVLLNSDGSVADMSGNGGCMNPGGSQDPPGDGGGGGGVIPLVLPPTPFTPGFSNTGFLDTPSMTGPSPAAGLAGADASTGTVTTPTAPASHPTAPAGVSFIQAPSLPWVVNPQTPVSAGASVTNGTPTSTTTTPETNVTSPAPLGISRTKTGDAPPAGDGGTDGDNAAPPEPTVDPGDGVAILRDDYFAQRSSALLDVAVVDGATASRSFLPAAVLVIGSAGLPAIGNRGGRRRRALPIHRFTER
jgi:uncharacterized delta-60 repeat protein